ncbi:hypothetical protein TorRG33x02_091120 [Trema orientale]|uniref:Uncharacterized protein n=1 Tax=Trema orientale TaxID=63057 RepID=A0A2P5FBP6_TREOI|nr:hypothetical protein TorRG33x02_091120 [Trema orientale]
MLLICPSRRSIWTMVMPISLRPKPSFSRTREVIFASQKLCDQGNRLSLAQYCAMNSYSDDDAMATIDEDEEFVTCTMIFLHERAN